MNADTKDAGSSPVEQGVGRLVEQRANPCKLTECQGKPRCARCAAWDRSDPETMLPYAYLLDKLAMVMPLLEEARDALPAITEAQRKLHGISPTLAARMDVAGTFSIDDWLKPPNVRAERGPTA